MTQDSPGAPKTIRDYPTEGLRLPWATWIPDRRPEWKVHSDLGKAKNAIGYETRNSTVRGGVLYSLEDGKWTVCDVVEPGTKRSEHLMFSNPKKWNKAPGITTLVTEFPI